MAKYPYKSRAYRRFPRMRDGVDGFLWVKEGFDFQNTMERTKGDLVEVAGPTFDGYFFLENVDLPREVIITNSRPDGSYRPEFKELKRRAAMRIEAMVDVRQLPYADNSLGAVFCHALTMIEGDGEKRKPRKVEQDLLDQSYIEFQLVALGVKQPNQARASLRIRAYLEAYRALEPGGILITDGDLAELETLEQIGFERRAILGDIVLYSEIVVQKPVK